MRPAALALLVLLLAGCAANRACYQAARHAKMTTGAALGWCYVPPWIAR